MNTFIKDIINEFSIIFFPRRCGFCGEVIAFDETMCEECKNLKTIESPICLYCAVGKKDCHCKKHKHNYKCIIAPYYYEGSVIKAIHNLKFNDNSAIAVRMGIDVAEHINTHYAGIAFDFVTSIPLSSFRQNRRGYNQAELLAIEISKQLGIPYQKALKKIGRNKSQRTQNARQRKINVYGVYDVREKIKLDNSVILLIDDVKTTGSTLDECAKMLKLNGAKGVYAASVAVVHKVLLPKS